MHPFENMFDAASLASVIATDESGLITAFNTGAERLLGYDRAEVIGRCTPEKFHADEELKAQQKQISGEMGVSVSGFDVLVLRAREKGYEEREWVYIRKDGSRRFVNLGVTAMRDEQGTLTGYLGVATDITKRKIAEKTLLETQDMMQKVMDNIPQFIFWKDTESIYLGCNQNFAEVAGVGHPPNIIGKSDFELAWTQEEAEFFRLCDQRVMTSKQPEYHIIEPQQQADGKKAWLDTNKVPLVDDAGVVVGILGTFEDITDRRRIEETLRRNEEDLRITLNSLSEGVITTDMNGIVKRMNPVAEKLTGWAQPDAIGESLTRVFHSVDPREEAAEDLSLTMFIQGGSAELLAGTRMLTAKDGSQALVIQSCASLRSDTGGCSGLVFIFRDITKEVRLQEQLHHSQKLDAIGQLAGGIAHDFNNMLAGIMGGAELLEMSVPASEQTTPYLNLITESSMRAADLAKQLLAFSRRQSPGSTAIDLHQVIKDTVTLLKSTVDKRISIELSLDALVCNVIGDPAQLESAFLNIGINASQAMSDGGTLSFHTKVIDISEVDCQVSMTPLTPGPYIEVEVVDTGCGISQEHVNRIFEPFFTTKETGKGTGLGLSASLGTIQQHQGRISVYSELGRGTSMNVILPITDVETSSVPMESPVQMGQGRILIVDDEELLRESSEALLSACGYEIVTAENGEDAVAYYQQHHETIDLVLLDMVMPVMNGRDCFFELKRINPEVRVVLASGFTHDEDLTELQNAGLTGFIPKPYRSAKLSQVIAQAL